MKICKLIFRGFQQFENTDLDFTDPLSGEPANRICLIGRNGTGKSTILRVLDQLLTTIPRGMPVFGKVFAVKLKVGEDFVYAVSGGGKQPVFLFQSRIEDVPGWIDDLADEPTKIGQKTNSTKYRGYLLKPEIRAALLDKMALKNNDSDLVVFSPPEATQNAAIGIGDVPQTNLDAALKLFKSFPFHHNVSNQTISEMWRVLVFLVKKRENDRIEFEERKENLTKTKGELIDEFDRDHPKILHELAALWNEILDRAGLEFDVEGASNPIQLSDNLKAYIRLKSTKQKVAYSQLSTGTRDFIFRIGHIFLLYFGRRIERGFILIDEPENSLFPDFLFNLMDIYDRIVRDENGTFSTQMFFATHSPIIAAQFQPHERIILDWEEESGHVVAKKGRAPIGDDPNDLLRKDFETRLLGKAGEEKWQEYLDLKKRLRNSSEKSEKDDLIARVMEIGTDYGFPTTND